MPPRPLFREAESRDNRCMLFRRQPPAGITFHDRLEELRRRGFRVEDLGQGAVTVRSGSCAAVVQPAPQSPPRIARLGVALGDKIGLLVDGGFQKFIETPDGRRRPALAKDLRALHDFQESLREALGLETFYNESLGTICDRHAYDRLAGR